MAINMDNIKKMDEDDDDEPLSPHMVARWYRPTEIILGSEKYD